MVNTVFSFQVLCAVKHEILDTLKPPGSIYAAHRHDLAIFSGQAGSGKNLADAGANTM